MNECYHNSWLAGWMYEGDMRLFFFFWNHPDTYQRGCGEWSLKAVRVV